jgi:acyl carrier protein
MKAAPEPEQIKSAVLRILGRIAPEADPAEVKPDIGLRDQLDMDSMDFLNFVLGLHEEFGVDIPESDYPALATIDGCVRYVQRKLEK